MIQVLVVVFADDPPVFSRSAGAPAPSRPPYPPGQGGGSALPYPTGMKLWYTFSYQFGFNSIKLM